MLFRVRTRLTDTPGALATLAERCGVAGVNILALQIHPHLGSVTDELVVDAPEDWAATAVADLVGGAGGDEVSVSPCTTHDLLDQPTRWLRVAVEAVQRPERLPDLVAGLMGDRAEWTAAERGRADALEDLVSAASEAPSAVAGSGGGQVDYAVSADSVDALIAGHLVGRARLTGRREDGAAGGRLEVAPAWRRLGIGSALLVRLTRLAAEQGHADLVLWAPSAQEGVLPMLAACGLRGRVRLTEHGLSVRIGLTGVHAA